MKVFELMSELSELPAGTEVKVNICITTEELKDGDRLDDYNYALEFDVETVDECGNISTIPRKG